jgi:hypothetical protein
LFAATVNPTSDGADRSAGCFGNLVVCEADNVAQNNGFSEFVGEFEKG